MYPVRFEDPYDHINHKEHYKYDTHIVDTHDDHNREDNEEEVNF